MATLTGDAKLLISHFRDEDLLCRDAGQRIFDAVVQAHKHVSEFEDQDDFDNAFYKLHRERNQTLLQFANVARAAYLQHDAYGYPLPDEGHKGYSIHLESYFGRHAQEVWERNWMNPDMHTMLLDTKLLNATLLDMYNPLLMETILKKLLEQF